MRVKGMQQSASIRSLSARDSRKELVTVRRRRLRSSTATTRAFPQTLSTKISAYSRTRTVRSSSAGARSQAAQRARERLRVPALRCARELLRPSLRRTRCQDAVPGRGATRAELQHGDSGRAAGTRCCRSPRPNPACPESRSSLGRARGRRHRERSGPARASPGAWHPRARAARCGAGAGGSLGFPGFPPASARDARCPRAVRAHAGTAVR